MQSRGTPSIETAKRVIDEMRDFENVAFASDRIEFKFIEFNPRRKSRGAEAARVSVDGEWMWMSKKDIKCNIREFGPDPELLKAFESYE